jgi:hypothetical protein
LTNPDVDLRSRILVEINSATQCQFGHGVQGCWIDTLRGGKHHQLTHELKVRWADAIVNRPRSQSQPNILRPPEEIVQLCMQNTIKESSKQRLPLPNTIWYQKKRRTQVEDTINKISESSEEEEEE